MDWVLRVIRCYPNRTGKNWEVLKMPLQDTATCVTCFAEEAAVSVLQILKQSFELSCLPLLHTFPLCSLCVSRVAILSPVLPKLHSHEMEEPLLSPGGG